MKYINRRLINEVIDKARSSERKRMNYNFHETSTDPLQRMLNALEPGTYVQPHKHESPDKREAFIILSGKILTVIFNDDGSIKEHFILSAAEGKYGIDIPPRTYHMIIALQSGSVVYEVKDGPYEPIDDKNFAPWAPKEGNPECENYLNNILKELKI